MPTAELGQLITELAETAARGDTRAIGPLIARAREGMQKVGLDRSRRDALERGLTMLERVATVRAVNRDAGNADRPTVGLAVEIALDAARAAAAKGDQEQVVTQCHAAAGAIAIMARNPAEKAALGEYLAGAAATLLAQSRAVATRRHDCVREAAFALAEAERNARTDDQALRAAHLARYRGLREEARGLADRDSFAELCRRAMEEVIAAELTRALAEAAEGDLEAVAFTGDWVRALLRDDTLTHDRMLEISAALRAIERDAYRKATNDALEAGFAAARAHDDARRNEICRATRRYLERAIALGADEAFRSITHNRLEALMLTGVQKSDGSAKPADSVAKPYNAAKSDRRDQRRYRMPVLLVTLGTGSYRTIDWSVGGMMLGDYDGPLERGHTLPVSFPLGQALHRSKCRILHVDRDSRRLKLQFSEPPPSLLAALRALIRSKAGPG